MTGGSGVAVGLPNNFREIGDIGGTAASWQGQTGRCVALSGSCSQATRRQVAVHAHEHPTLALDPAAILHGVQTVDDVVAWFAGCEGIPLVYSSADPETVAELQHRHGQHNIAVGLETFFANLARRLLDVGVHRLISAGGETSGAIVEGLGIKAFEIGPEIDPGVPALRAGPQLTIALKSGILAAMTFSPRQPPVCCTAQIMTDTRLREQLCELARSLFERGLTAGSTGNISARTADGGLLVSPTGSSFGRLDPAVLARFDASGHQIDGAPPTKEMPLHLAFYESRRQVGAVVHLHSCHSVALSLLPGQDADDFPAAADTLRHHEAG